MDGLPAYAPQPLADLLPIYRPQNTTEDHVQTYQLLQTSSSTQLISSTDNHSDPNPSYTIKSFRTGGFMNRKPHVIIYPRDSDQKTSIAEARFDIHGTGTTISYTNNQTIQRLELEDSRLQILETAIQGIPHYWQPMPANNKVFELTNEHEDTVARFVHMSQAESPSTSPQRSTSVMRRSNSVWSIQSNRSVTARSKTAFSELLVGQLHIVDSHIDNKEARVEILCSAILVVERARRRRAVLENNGSSYGVVRSVGRNGVAYIPQ